MNVYDFDDTIYNGDTNKDLIKYSLKKYPMLVIKSLLKARKLNKEYKKDLIAFERVKEEMLSFIFQIPNYPKFINSFVKSHMKNIKPWYLNRKTEYDVILSASYELWIKLFARELGVKVVIATRTNSDGKIIGKNCKKEEKVNRLKEVFPDLDKIEAAYGDSSCDIPVLDIAKNAYVVEGNKLVTYKRGYKFKTDR